MVTARMSSFHNVSVVCSMGAAWRQLHAAGITLQCSHRQERLLFLVLESLAAWAQRTEKGKGPLVLIPVVIVMKISLNSVAEEEAKAAWPAVVGPQVQQEEVERLLESIGRLKPLCHNS
jgi:hypothetical protein